MNNRIEELIKELNLVKHEEGGYFFRVFYSDNVIFSYRHQKERRAVSSIYFLLTKDEVSYFHRLNSDEIWHFYEGDNVKIYTINEKFNNYTTITLGKNLHSPSYCTIVKGGQWQAAEVLGEYALVGCSVAPAFEYDDFVMLKDDAVLRKKAIKIFPELSRFI